MKNREFSNGTYVRTLVRKTVHQYNSVKAIFVIATVLTVSACGSGDSGASPAATDDGATGGATAGTTGGTTGETTGETSSSSGLAGTWVQCIAGTGSLNDRTTYTMTDSRYVKVIAFFESEDCSGDQFEGNGVVQVVTEGTYELTGSSTSEEGLSVQLLSLIVDKTNGVAVPVMFQVPAFGIVYTGTANQLVFSRLIPSESARPTMLDLDAPFIRQ